MMTIPMRRLWLAACALGVAAVVAGPVGSARAAPHAPGVTLRVSANTVSYGQYVRFSGHISPRTGGQTVDVVDGKGHRLARATTTSNGSYHAATKPKRNMTVHARWGAVSSDPVRGRVRPRLTASRGTILLFGTTMVTGRLVPAMAGEHIDVTLVREGRTVRRVRPRLRRDGTFRAGLRVLHPGRQSVLVHFKDGAHLGVSWRSNPATPPLPYLHTGSSGTFVRLLERRLAELHYHLPGVDSTFDYRTADTVMAFHKVQGMARTNAVDTATWYRLSTPRVPVLRGPRKGNHFEVDLTKQVVDYVHRGVIAGVIHTSTGKPSTPTRPGDFHVWSKHPGYNSEGMYYSSFFD